MEPSFMLIQCLLNYHYLHRKKKGNEEKITPTTFSFKVCNHTNHFYNKNFCMLHFIVFIVQANKKSAIFVLIILLEIVSKPPCINFFMLHIIVFTPSLAILPERSQQFMHQYCSLVFDFYPIYTHQFTYHCQETISSKSLSCQARSQNMIYIIL